MKKYIVLYLTFVVFPLKLYSQQAKVNTGDKNYNNYAYSNAIKSYENVADKGYKSEGMFKRLGNSYYFNSDFENAAKWYGELFAMNVAVEPEYYYRYAQSLKSAGEIEKSNKYFAEFNAKNLSDNRTILYNKDQNYREEIKKNSGRYTVENAAINSPYSDYGSFVYNHKVYFASARDTGNFTKRKHKWTGKYFTNIYNADIDSVTNLPSKVNKIKTTLNSRFNESSPVFTKDGKTVYFTRNNFVKGKKGKDSTRTTLIKIYKATLENDKWTNIAALPFTSDNYSTAHPALSPDEKILYFASDMPGTVGQSDIYKVDINNGSFGAPINLGKSSNTEGKETFPYVTQDEIYFASDGHPGLGGLDVFVGQIEDNGTISNIQNVGADINSPKDDFAYVIDPVSRRGYFSSNKDGGQGSDDIYVFLENKKLKCTQELEGIITDVITGHVLPETKVTLHENGVEKSTMISDAAGFYTFSIECGKTYLVKAEKQNYKIKELSVNIGKLNGKTSLPITLDHSRCKFAVGDDLGKCFGIKMIYFDLNKWSIETKAEVDLEKILAALNHNPNLKLDIRSYTDSRGSSKYNESLSDKRAKATIEWLVNKGISQERLTGKGYGESQLVNGCSDGVKCSEEEHSLNRRSEFIIIAI
ncbi:OmpA family protein [Flavobacterium sp. MMLR14_040]|uniref:OmpA family protein n=1 Tax=Flavobacterium sp. MMLR14_040 TaxID=3093843 RepID=UPI00299077EE|nr:OmpA family protein [Flavobacterium sp. MMLR14_040]MDW8850723.1 OmpA family protein [Flavobacterium sp. MMLR14_040]